MSLVRKLLLHFHLYRERDGTFVLTSKVNHETSFRVHPLGFLGRTDGDGGLGLPNRPLHVRSRELMRRRKQRTDGHKLIAYPWARIVCTASLRLPASTCFKMLWM